MCGLVGASYDADKKDEAVENVMEQIWKYSQSYSIGNEIKGDQHFSGNQLHSLS